MASLDELRANQLEKIEELKSKTAYNTTKELIERYETPVKMAKFVQDPLSLQKDFSRTIFN